MVVATCLFVPSESRARWIFVILSLFLSLLSPVLFVVSFDCHSHLSATIVVARCLEVRVGKGVFLRAFGSMPASPINWLDLLNCTSILLLNIYIYFLGSIFAWFRGYTHARARAHSHTNMLTNFSLTLYSLCSKQWFSFFLQFWLVIRLHFGIRRPCPHPLP